MTNVDHAETAERAKAQIRAAYRIRSRHHRGRLGLCTCGRPHPCTVIAACTTAITESRATLAILEATVPLAIITPRQAT